MPNHLKEDISSIDTGTYSYIFEQNVSIPLKGNGLPVRANIYRPKTDEPVPVIATLGPYGKDVPYIAFNPPSFAEVNPKQKCEHSAWETPDPVFWTQNGYAVIRADEPGIGQSPGNLQVLSDRTIQAYHDVVEWAADQPWSTGKIGLLGISYYAITQWRVAALNPRGLAAICPWEGATDYYRDFSRNGGILSNSFGDFWWKKQVAPNQYGRAGRAESGWCPDTIDGDLTNAELDQARTHVVDEARTNRFRDTECYKTRECNLGNITVPLLSVANWGGNSLHLRGNMQGFIHSRSEFKYLRTIVGRHDLPFYLDENVDLQLGWFDAWLKGYDRVGWTRKGEVPAVNVVLRKGNVGFNDPVAERAYKSRDENEWPIARTQYTKFHLGVNNTLKQERDTHQGEVSYRAPSDIDNQQLVQFTSDPFLEEVEITGHSVAHLNVSVTQDINGPAPSDIDLFVTLRYIGLDGKEVHYTGTVGDPVPLAKGWLRVSLRQVDKENTQHREWLPYREYTSKSALPVRPGEVYPVDVEIWPTNVVAERGGKIVLEVASGDTQGAGLFLHNDPKDRSLDVLQGTNNIHFGQNFDNYLSLPFVPNRSKK